MYARLPDRIRLQTRKAYELFMRNPSHPGLKFKKIEGEEDVYSARVGFGYRVLGRVDGEEIVWFWIGPHSDYDKVI
jgi:mRNA-degrading endonuclease RelE of RelBE toxin-antitoxin system